MTRSRWTLLVAVPCFYLVWLFGFLCLLLLVPRRRTWAALAAIGILAASFQSGGFDDMVPEAGKTWMVLQQRPQASQPAPILPARVEQTGIQVP